MEAEQNGTTEKRKRRRWEKAFLTALAETGNISASCRAANVGRTTVHNATLNWPDFKTEYDTAYEESLDNLEKEARRRAHDGLLRYKFQKDGTPLLHPVTGEPYYEHEYSDTLLIFLLKGGRPKKYRDNVKHEHSLEDIDAAIAAELARLAGAGQGSLPGTTPANPDAGTSQGDCEPAG